MRVLAVLGEGAETSCSEFRISPWVVFVQTHGLPIERPVQEASAHACLCCIMGKVWWLGVVAVHSHQQYLSPETLRRKVTFTDRPF